MGMQRVGISYIHQSTKELFHLRELETQIPMESIQYKQKKKMEKFNNIKALVESLEKDANAFYNKGNKSAGTRLRVAMQNLKQLAQELRIDVQDIKNTEKN
jgi:hypothetical protein